MLLDSHSDTILFIGGSYKVRRRLYAWIAVSHRYAETGSLDEAEVVQIVSYANCLVE